MKKMIFGNYKVGTKGYVVVNETLTPAIISRARFNLENGEVEQFVKIDDMEMPLTSKFYQDEEHYLKGDAYDMIERDTYQLIYSDNEAHRLTYVQGAGEEVVIMCWKFIDGEPKRVKLDFKCYNESVDRQWFDDVDLSSCYATIDSCMAWNDYAVQNEDGTKSTRKALLKALSLTEGQKAIMDEFSNVLKKMKDAHITVVWCSEESNLSAINTSEIDVDFVWDGVPEGYKEASQYVNDKIESLYEINGVYQLWKSSDETMVYKQKK